MSNPLKARNSLAPGHYWVRYHERWTIARYLGGSRWRWRGPDGERELREDELAEVGAWVEMSGDDAVTHGTRAAEAPARVR